MLHARVAPRAGEAAGAHTTKHATAMHLALLASLGRLGLSEHMLRLEDVTAVHTREVRASRGWVAGGDL